MSCMKEDELKQNIKIFAARKGVSPNIVRVIPKSELEFGKVYEGECRNADEARWGDGKFVYERYKFGHRYEELINHFEDDDGYDVFVPMEVKERIKIFLAGTIDDGHSNDWQGELLAATKDLQKEVEFYNPRRYDFPEHPKKEDVVKQIRWEQEHLDKADFILMVLLEGSKSPISLLELGLYAHYQNKIAVCCPESFYRYTNVEETCRKYGLYLTNRTDTQHLVTVIEWLINYNYGKKVR